MSVIFAREGLNPAGLDSHISATVMLSRQRYPGADIEAVDLYRADAHEALFNGWLGQQPLVLQALQRQTRLDAAPNGGVNGGLFLARQLESVAARVLEEPLPPLNGLVLFPTNTEVKPGAISHVVRRVYQRGKANLYRGGQRPVSRVTLTQKEEAFPVRHLVDAFDWSIFEQNSADFANFSLVERGIRAANRAIAELHNSLIWEGSSVDGLYGILNYPWLDKKVVATEFSSSADADEMLAEIFSLIEYPENNSRQAFSPTDVVFSTKLYNFLARTRVKDTTGNGSSTTMLKYIAENNSAGIPLARFHKAHELQDLSVGGETLQGVLVYRNDEDGIRVVEVQSTTALPLQQVGFQNSQYFYKSVGGVVMADVGNNLLAYVDLAE